MLNLNEIETNKKREIIRAFELFINSPGGEFLHKYLQELYDNEVALMLDADISPSFTVVNRESVIGELKRLKQFKTLIHDLKCDLVDSIKEKQQEK